MRYKYTITILYVTIPIVLCVRIPANPCPEIFQYYKDLQGNIYGEATVPYDNATYMEFTVNASFLGNFNKPKLKLEMVTELHELNDYVPYVIYNIFFPFTDVIPKITAIHYNGRRYCSGPGEPVIPGQPGVTNVWHQISFRFSRRQVGFYEPETKPDSTDIDIPVKKPKDRPTKAPPKIEPPVVVKPITHPIIPPTVPPTVPPTIPPTPQWTPPQIPTNLPPKTPEIDPDELDPIDQGLINIIFPPPQVTSAPTSATFTSPPVIANEDFKCGIASNELPSNSLVPLIWGGTDTEIGEYPWLVAFFMNKGPKYDYKCSANLISDKHVITAARCIQWYNIQIVKTEEIFLVMGTNSLQNWNSNGAVTRRAISVAVHPAFKENSESAHGDLAIIKMDRAVQFAKDLSPVCLWKGSSDLYPLTNKMGVIAGFGQDEDSKQNGLTHALRAKRADLPIISQTECLTSPLGFNDVTSDRTFCTKSGDSLTGPCIGDSGAGFFIQIDDAYYLRGIASAVSVSNGICDLTNKYSVFCDVAKFIDWVKSNMT